jgi:hypothetical protein
MNFIQRTWNEKPLAFVLTVALAVRFLAVFFSEGYLMHDDHFLTVEISGSWANGHNYCNWMPGIDNDREHPEPISFFYLGGLYVAFKALLALGIENPSVQMIFIRLLHALLSVWVIYFAYRITEMISTTQRARLVGLLLALLAVLPNFGVRNLVEMVCQLPLLGGFYLLVRHGLIVPSEWGSLRFQSSYASVQKTAWLWLVVAAFVMGLAVGIRYQTVLMLAMVGVVFLAQKQIVQGAVFGLVSFIGFFVTQIDDVLMWGGQPFQHLTGYIEYNNQNKGNYPGAPLTYVSFITYFIFPPVSLFLAFGFLRSWRKHLMLFLPAFVFLIFHILFPNRQERFILPALPFVVMLGVIGWSEWVEHSKFWLSRPRLLRGLWIFFWTVNTITLAVFTFTTAKKARMEAMSYLYDQGDCQNFIIEYSHTDGGAMPPVFYADKYVNYYIFRNNIDIEKTVKTMPAAQEVMANRLQKKPIPNYVLFYDEKNLKQRIERLQALFPTLTFETKVQAGWFDRLLHEMNPKNSLEEIYIYKIK